MKNWFSFSQKGWTLTCCETMEAHVEFVNIIIYIISIPPDLGHSFFIYPSPPISNYWGASISVYNESSVLETHSFCVCILILYFSSVFAGC